MAWRAVELHHNISLDIHFRHKEFVLMKSDENCRSLALLPRHLHRQRGRKMCVLLKGII